MKNQPGKLSRIEQIVIWITFSLSFLFLIIAVSFSTLFFIVMGNPFDKNPFNDKPFVREEWKHGSDRDRAYMTYDLLKHHLRKGMTANEVMAELGQSFVMAPISSREELKDSRTNSISTLAKVDESKIMNVSFWHLGNRINDAVDINHAALLLYFDKDKRYLGGKIGW